MKNFALINDNTVVEIIPEFDPIFPNTPIEQRYPADVVARLIEITDNVVEVGYTYENGTFTAPAEIEAPIEDTEVVDTETELTQMELNLDFDYRLSCLELGLN